MADEFDIDDLLEAPYQKAKTEDVEVNIYKVQMFGFFSYSKFYRRWNPKPIIYPACFFNRMKWS